MQRQVAPAPLPNVRVPVQAPAGAFQSGLEQALPAIAQASAQRDVQTRAFELKVKQDGDEMAVNSAERKLADARISILQDPQKGALNRRGVNALGSLADAQEAWQKATSDIGATLQNDEQRARFATRERGHYGQMIEQIAAHTSAEVRKADALDSKSFLDDGLSAVHGDPTKAPSAITDARKRLIEFGQREGWSPETLKEKASEHVSDIHTTAIGALVERKTYDSAKAAKAYLDANRGEMTGKQLVQADKLVAAGLVDGEALKATDTILGDVQKAEQQGTPQTLMQALEQTKTIEDPKVRAEVSRQVRRHFADIAADQRQQRAAAFQSAGQILEQTKDLSKIPTATWMLLSPAERRGLKHDEDQARHPEKRKTSDMETYMSLLNASVLNEDTRQAFAKVNLYKYRTVLSDADYKEMVHRQAAILGENTRTKKAADKKAAPDPAHPWRAILNHPAATVTTQQGASPAGNVAVPTKKTRPPTNVELDGMAQAKRDGAEKDYGDYLRGLGVAVP